MNNFLKVKNFICVLVFLVSFSLAGCDDPYKSITPAVRAVAREANNCGYYQAADSIRLCGTSSAVTVDDFVYLAVRCTYAQNRDTILLQGTSRANSVADFNKLANACEYSSNGDQIRQMASNFAASQSSNAAQSSSSNENAEVKDAHEKMTQAYNKYTEALNNNSDDLKSCEDDFIAKKSVYESLIKKD